MPAGYLPLSAHARLDKMWPLPGQFLPPQPNAATKELILIQHMPLAPKHIKQGLK